MPTLFPRGLSALELSLLLTVCGLELEFDYKLK